MAQYQLADITVCRESEIGEGKEYIVRSHLGNALYAGDSVMGYDMGTINFNSEDIGKYPDEVIPQIVLVRKFYPNQALRRRKRKWALKSLPKTKNTNMTKAQEAKEEADMDEFLDELERDEEYRKNVTIFKNPDAVTMTTMADPDEARVGLEEMLDGFELEQEFKQQLKDLDSDDE